MKQFATVTVIGAARPWTFIPANDWTVVGA